MLCLQECAQELARCLSEGGDQKGTEAHFRIQEIISARVRAPVLHITSIRLVRGIS